VIKPITCEAKPLAPQKSTEKKMFKGKKNNRSKGNDVDVVHQGRENTRGENPHKTS